MIRFLILSTLYPRYFGKIMKNLIGIHVFNNGRQIYVNKL